MEEVETPPKSKPESPNLLQDPGVQISPAKTTKENGARVSSDGKEGPNGISGDLDGGDTATLQMGGGKEVGLEDSEINGVSSLLKMQESKSLNGLDSVLVVIDQNEKMEVGNLGGDGDGVSLVADVCEEININPRDVKERRRGRRSLWRESLNAGEGHSVGRNREELEEEEEESGGEGHDFGIGDFVWGKIRSHPWWPGRVYDTVNASDFAMKVKQRDKILVAYFGDGTFAWCNPSQLKPLDENFVEMSRQSNSKNFVNAVEKAMDEVGRLVDLRMTCSCVPKENLIGFGRTLAVNAGIKEGLLIPEGGIHKLSSALFEPVEFLTSLKDAAKAGNVTNILGITVLTSWLSAFYRAKNGHQLPSYYDPQPVPGLEDDSGNLMVDLSNNGSGMEVRNQGPVEEDWLSSPRKHDQSTDSVLQRCQGGTYQRRKQKSLAEILEGKTDAEVENKDDVLAEDMMTPSKSSSSAKRKKKPVGEKKSADSEMMDATEGASLGKSATSSGKKKRKVSDKADAEEKNKMDIAKTEESLEKSHSSSGGKKRKDDDETHVDKDGSNAKGGAKALTAKRPTSKESKLSESVAGDNINVTCVDTDAGKVKKERVNTPLARGRKKKASSNDIGDDNSKDKNVEMKEKTVSIEKVKVGPSDNGEAEEQARKGSLLRERKRSKYLSPPYTNLNKGQRKSEIEAESPKVSSESQFIDSLTKATGHLTGGPQILEPGDEKFQKKAPGAIHETSDDSVHLNIKQDQNKIIDPAMVKAPVSDVLSKMRFAARNPLYPKETNSRDVVGEFVSAFRNYCNVTDRESGELPSVKKRKSQKRESGSLVKEISQTDQSSPVEKPRQTKTKRSKEAKLDQPKVQQAATTEDKEPGEEASGAALFVTFGPGSSLPNKDDLVNIYGKYGALNKGETEMFYTSYCARVVFLKTSEAEEAFNQSQLSSPFKSANVTFRLRYLSADTKTRELRNIPSKKSSSLAKDPAGTSSVSQSMDSNVSQMKFIKQKLEMIQSLLRTSGGKISVDIKSNLEGEIKVILEKVSSMVDSST